MMHAAEVAERLNLKRYRQSWRGRCPCCDYAANTFWIRAGTEGRALLFCANGCTREELTEAVARATGLQQAVQRGEEDDAARRGRNRERGLALWSGSESAVGTLADHYLTARGLPGLAASSALRFRGDTPHPEGGRTPAMIALITDVVGAPLGVHRTYLGRDGRKALVKPAKASLGPVWGGAIRLDPLKPHVALVIGEGIETSASAGCLMGFPAWAAVSAGNLAKGLVLPPEVRRVVIAADPDAAGRDAAREGWLRWKAEGREVQIASPDRESSDFNDLLLAREGRCG